MSKLVIDTEKLSYGLEKGIGETRTTWAFADQKDRLRFVACGLVATAIDLHAEQEGITSRLVISEPNIPFDPEMRHVFPLLGDSETVVDASVSQFLEHGGLSLEYERVTGEKIYPEEKILVFDLAERHCVVRWLADAIERFQSINTHPYGLYSRKLGVGALAASTHNEVEEALRPIWEPRNLRSWTPPEHVLRDAEIVNRSIPSGALQISA